MPSALRQLTRLDVIDFPPNAKLVTSEVEQNG
jgi:hypothetical protein